MDYGQYIQPELLILVPVLYLIAEGIKRSEILENKYIPLLLGALGIFMALLYGFSENGISMGTVFTGLVQGILVAGCAVYTYETYKHAKIIMTDSDSEPSEK